MAGSIGAEAEGGLVGRAGELGQIRLALRRVAGGIGEAMLVTGEAGIGKTRVVAEGGTAAVAGGLQILRGAADELEQRRPFVAIGDCLALGRRTADSRRAAITRLLRDDAGVGGGGDWFGETAQAEFRVVEAVVALVEDLSARSPVLLPPPAPARLLPRAPLRPPRPAPCRAARSQDCSTTTGGGHLPSPG